MKKILMILFAATFIFGCSDNKTDEGSTAKGEISLSAAKIEFQTSGSAIGDNSIKVTSSDKWRVAGKKDWCTPSVTEGTNGQNVTFTALPNPLTEPRSVTFSFICGNKTQTVVVTQKQSAVLDFLDTDHNVNPAGGPYAIRVKANVDLKCEVAEVDKDWITNTTTRSAETMFVTFEITENKTYSERTGSVIFTVDGKESVVSLHQLQNDAVIPTKTLYNFMESGGEFTVDLQKNLNYKISIPQTDTWIKQVVTTVDKTRGLVPDQVTFTADPTTVSRIGRVDFVDVNNAKIIFSTVWVKQSVANPIYQDIPDENFRAYLAGMGYIMSADEVKCEVTGAGLNATVMLCSNKNIKSLEGLEIFAKLAEIDCGKNHITKLDLSKNGALDIYGWDFRLTPNPFEEIIFPSHMKSLPSFYNNLYDFNTQVWSKKLKISGENIAGSASITTNELESIDLSDCPKITTFNCYNNPNLTSINIKNCVALQTISAYGTPLESLDLSEFVALKTLNCYNSKLKELILPNTATLTTIACYNNLITSLDVSKNTGLTSLKCNINKLTSLDVSNNLKMTTLNCIDNPDLAKLFMAEGQAIKTLSKPETTQIVIK